MSFSHGLISASVHQIKYFLSSIVCSVTVILNPLHLFFPSPDCLCSLRSLAPFLLLGSLHLDVPGRGAALHHAGRGV